MTNSRKISSLLLISLAAICCTRIADAPATSDDCFYATIVYPDTCTELYEDMSVCWSVDDKVSIFNGSTINSLYQVTESSAGTASAVLKKIQSEDIVAGTEIGVNVACYPYNDSLAIQKTKDDGYKFNIDFLSEQHCLPHSFAKGESPMVAITSSVDDRNLNFRNICGLLRFQIKGVGNVRTVIFNGNDNEVVAGKAAVFVKKDSISSVIQMESGIKEIRIDCGEKGVSLRENIISNFYLVLPPVKFKKGFTVTFVMNNGSEIPIKTTKEVVIRRTAVTSIEPVNLNAVNFNDTRFKDFCLSNFDFNHDGEISLKEAAKIRKMDCSNLGIKSLDGVEKFISLNYLDCTGNPDLKNLFLVRGIMALKTDPELEISYKKFTRPVFTIIDDDFLPDYVDNLYAICGELGIKCDFAAIPYEDTEFIEACSIRIKPYLDTGHEFLLHPWHQYWYNDNMYNKFVDVGHCEQSLTRSINTFNSISGLEKNSDCLVYPGNSSDRDEVVEMCSNHVWMGIKSGGHCNTDLSHPYHMQRLAIDMNLGKDAIKKRIRDAVNQNAWIIFAMHISNFAIDDTVDNYSWTTGNLKDILQYAQNFGEFKKYSEVVSAFTLK